jgi:DNA polymerase-3 subunit delta
MRIVATLVGQWRTWLQVKAIQESGERDDKVIAQFAELGNPKRVYFLKKEVQSLRAQQLFQGLVILLELEANLKRGAEEVMAMQTAVIRLGTCSNTPSVGGWDWL